MQVRTCTHICSSTCRYNKAAKAKEDTEESLKRRPLSAGEPEMPSQVGRQVCSPYLIIYIHAAKPFMHVQYTILNAYIPTVC